MRLTNEWNLPDPIYQAELRDTLSYTRRSDISVTELSCPPRQIALRRRHEGELTEDISQRMRSFQGKAIHAYLEQHTDGIRELYLRVSALGWSVSGRIDRLYRKDASWIAQDIKYVNPYATRDGPKAEWVEQLNLYQVLLDFNRLPCDALEVLPIYVGWDEDNMGWKEYPQKPAEIIPIEKWSISRAREFFRERVQLHQDAQRSLPYCSAEERWFGWDKKLKQEVSKRCRKFCNVAVQCDALNDGQVK